MSKMQKDSIWRMKVRDYLADHPGAELLEANEAVMREMIAEKNAKELGRDLGRLYETQPVFRMESHGRKFETRELTMQQQDNIGGQPVPCLSDGGQSMGIWIYCDLPIEHDGKHAGWCTSDMHSEEHGTRFTAHRTEWEDS